MGSRAWPFPSSIWCYLPLLSCRPSTPTTSPLSQTGVAGKLRARGTRAGRSQTPRSHHQRAHGWPASITGVDQSPVTKAIPLLPCRHVRRLAPRYWAPVGGSRSGVDLCWELTSTPAACASLFSEDPTRGAMTTGRAWRQRTVSASPGRTDTRAVSTLPCQGAWAGEPRPRWT